MLFYSVLIFMFCFASAVLSDRSSKQGQSQLFKRSEGPPSTVAGATFTDYEWSALSTIATQFRVPTITKDLQNPSSAALGIILDGLHGCPGAFVGVQIIVDKGEVYSYAVSRKVASVNYDVLEKSESGVHPGDWVTISIDDMHQRKSFMTNVTDNSSGQSWLTRIDLGAALCSDYASWVVEKLPNLPLTKFDPVGLLVQAESYGTAYDTGGIKAFSSHEATASVSSKGLLVTITAE